MFRQIIETNVFSLSFPLQGRKILQTAHERACASKIRIFKISGKCKFCVWKICFELRTANLNKFAYCKWNKTNKKSKIQFLEIFQKRIPKPPKISTFSCLGWLFTDFGAFWGALGVHFGSQRATKMASKFHQKNEWFFDRAWKRSGAPKGGVRVDAPPVQCPRGGLPLIVG